MGFPPTGHGVYPENHINKEVILRCSLPSIQCLVTKLVLVFNTHDTVLLTEIWSDKFSDLTTDKCEHFALYRTENKSSKINVQSQGSSCGVIVLYTEWVCHM